MELSSRTFTCHAHGLWSNKQQPSQSHSAKVGFSGRWYSDIDSLWTQNRYSTHKYPWTLPAG